MLLCYNERAKLGVSPDRLLGEERLLEVKSRRKFSKKGITLDVRMNSYGIVPFISFSTYASWPGNNNSTLLPFRLHLLDYPPARNQSGLSIVGSHHISRNFCFWCQVKKSFLPKCTHIQNGLYPSFPNRFKSCNSLK